jgi:hypothetical protein
MVEVRKSREHSTQQKEEMITMAHVSPAEIEKNLKGINYPAKKQDLIKHAQQQGAQPEVVETLRELPEENFNSPIDVSKAIGEMDRGRQ